MVAFLQFQFLLGEEYAVILLEIFTTEIRTIYLCAASTDTQHFI